MTHTARLIVSIVFTAIALFLVTYTWVPSRDSLRSEEGKVSNVMPRPNTWYEVEVMTDSGARLSCRTRRGWVPEAINWANRCPLGQLESVMGQAITVLHDGARPYEVRRGDKIILSYGAHRQAQVTGMILALLMLAMVAWVWRRRAVTAGN
jgi:hypothetical protein